jgi:hypothetical protein
MEFAFYFGLMSVIMGFVAWAWVRGIDRAMRDWPDYRGEDLFDEIPRAKKPTETGEAHGDGAEKSSATNKVNTKI